MTNHVFARESFRNALAFITAVSRVILYFLDGETRVQRFFALIAFPTLECVFWSR